MPNENSWYVVNLPVDAFNYILTRGGFNGVLSSDRNMINRSSSVASAYAYAYAKRQIMERNKPAL